MSRKNTEKSLYLNAHETELLRHILILKEQAEFNFRDCMTRILESRKLDPQKWGVSTVDLKTLVELKQAPAQTPVPALTPAPTNKP